MSTNHFLISKKEFLLSENNFLISEIPFFDTRKYTGFSDKEFKFLISKYRIFYIKKSKIFPVYFFSLVSKIQLLKIKLIFIHENNCRKKENKKISTQNKLYCETKYGKN